MKREDAQTGLLDSQVFVQFRGRGVCGAVGCHLGKEACMHVDLSRADRDEGRVWSAFGKEVLGEVLVESHADLEGLPPVGFVGAGDGGELPGAAYAVDENVPCSELDADVVGGGADAFGVRQVGE